MIMYGISMSVESGFLKECLRTLITVKLDMVAWTSAPRQAAPLKAATAAAPVWVLVVHAQLVWPKPDNQ